jgi:hypothetical protein
MADASHPFDARRRRSRDWGDTFANLPLETPPLSAWSQIAARLDSAGDSAAELTDDGAAAPSGATPAATPIRSRRTLSTRTWLALAASLSALALLPVLWSGTRDVSDAATPSLAEAHSEASAPRETVSRDAARSAAASTALTAGTVAALDRNAPTAAIVASVPHKPTPSPVAAQIDPLAVEAAPQLASALPAPTAPLMPTPQQTPDAAMPAPDTVALASPQPDAVPANAVLVGDADADATGREMEMLYTASAQLETLLAYTRDPRVETGPAAALSSQIHSRLAKIDARLSLPDLSAREQYVLWQARVGTLRQAVAFESELRALAAEGQGYEGQLVEVN